MNMQSCAPDTRVARRIVVSGRVQGVGFRPFVYRLAQLYELNGWVRNIGGNVVIQVEGRAESIGVFLVSLAEAAPPLARPRLESVEDSVPQWESGFRILASAQRAGSERCLPPDLFCCDDCLAELRDRSARRHRYAFTNCTQCGPRYTIIADLPYDRANTSMALFTMCPRCRAEYENPGDRRFHAQPLACPDCGPTLSFRSKAGDHADGEAALDAAIACLRAGKVVAVKGIGGYHLMCDAANHRAVMDLRGRKLRPHKPLAVMCPYTGKDGLDTVRQCVILNGVEAQAILEAQRPVVLARRRDGCGLSDAVAPGLSELGVFLPYSPLHHILLGDMGTPLVATSGNISGEPVLTSSVEARLRLSDIADAFLDHDRPILRPADDSVVRMVAGRIRPLRIGRGMTPLEINVGTRFSEPLLAVGGHVKGAVALAWEQRVVISPYIGELDSPRGLAVFEQVISDLRALYNVQPVRVVCDLHPRYASTRWARAGSLPLIYVQHHIAHASALAGEHPEVLRWLTFAWDGFGFGGRQELWGGETFNGAPGHWQRVASLRRFRIPGGERAAREPWRSAAALLWEVGQTWQPSVAGIELAAQAWDKNLGAIGVSSVGRLFDAAGALILGLDHASYEGQAAMMLESISGPAEYAVPLPLRYDDEGILRLDWEPLLPLMTNSALTIEARAGIFHESLSRAIVAQALALRDVHAFEAVGLTGGVFQNRRLTERVAALLHEAGIPVHAPSTLPANDGGLAFGQLIEARARQMGT